MRMKKTKTTIDIASPLYRQAKRYAELHNLTLKAVIEMGLLAVLSSVDERKKPFRLRKHTFGGKEVQKQQKDWSEVRLLAYEGRGG